MTPNSSKTCPVCESTIQDGEEKCPECGALIDKLDFDVDVEEDVPKKSIERVKELIMEEGDEELIETIKNLSLIDEEEEEEVEEVVTFACPICDAEVGEDATECPNCGAIFEVEEEEMEEEEEPISIDIEDELESYQKSIHLYEHSGLDMEYIKNDIDDLKEAAEEGEKEKCEQISQQIEEDLDHAEDINKCIKRGEHYLEALSEKTETSSLQDDLSKVFEGCEIGEYLVASKKANTVEDELEKSLQQEIDEEWLEEFIEEKTEEVREKLSDIEEEIGIEEVKERLDRAISIKNQGRMPEAVHRTLTVLESVQIMPEISEKIEEARDLIDELKDTEAASEYTQHLEETIDKIEIGKEAEFEESIEELIEEIQNQLNTEEEKELEEEEKEVEEKISEMKSLSEKAEEIGLEIDSSMIEEAVDHKNEGEFEEGLSKLEDFKEVYVEKFEDEIKGRMDELKERFGERFFEEKFPQDRMEEFMEKEEFEEALNLIQKKKDDLEDLQEREEKLIESTSEIQTIIEDAREIDFDIEGVKEDLEEAKQKVDEKKFDEAQEHIEWCEQELQQKLVQSLQGEIRNAKKKLGGLSREDVDVKKIISYLKKANQAKKEERLEKGFEALKKYKKKMEGISEL